MRLILRVVCNNFIDKNIRICDLFNPTVIKPNFMTQLFDVELFFNSGAEWRERY